MFGLFKKIFSTSTAENGKSVVCKDYIYMSETAKFEALSQLSFDENSNTIIVTWFDDTNERLQAFFNKKSCSLDVVSHKSIRSTDANSKQLVFAEHHPLFSKEQELYSRLGLSNPLVFSSLDEPLFSHFGSERIIELMKKMGMKEDEMIQHTLVSSSIKNAQAKIAKKVDYEQPANSQKSWFQKNYNLKK